jgi:hypothetical protein
MEHDVFLITVVGCHGICLQRVLRSCQAFATRGLQFWVIAGRFLSCISRAGLWDDGGESVLGC